MRDGLAVTVDALSLIDTDDKLACLGIAAEIDGPCAIVVVSARPSEGVVGRDSTAGAKDQPNVAIKAASCEGSDPEPSSVADERRSVVAVEESPSTSI